IRGAWTLAVRSALATMLVANIAWAQGGAPLGQAPAAPGMPFQAVYPPGAYAPAPPYMYPQPVAPVASMNAAMPGGQGQPAMMPAMAGQITERRDMASQCPTAKAMAAARCLKAKPEWTALARTAAAKAAISAAAFLVIMAAMEHFFLTDCWATSLAALRRIPTA